MKKTKKFTAVEMENNLFNIAKTAQNTKNVDHKRLNVSISAYRTILQVESLRIKANKAGVKSNSLFVR